MSRILTDQEIHTLLSDPKPLPADFRQKLKRRRRKYRQEERSARLDVTGKSGKRYRLYVKVNDQICNNFSVGLVYYLNATEKIGLIRCNGFHGPHTNKIERTIIPPDTPHIHTLTERYQLLGRPLGFAEATLRYVDVRSAISFVSRSYGFHCVRPDDSGQQSLFDE